MEAKDFAREALAWFFRRSDQAGKLYCASCLVEQLTPSREGRVSSFCRRNHRGGRLRQPTSAAGGYSRALLGLSEGAALRRDRSPGTLGRFRLRRERRVLEP